MAAKSTSEQDLESIGQYITPSRGRGGRVEERRRGGRLEEGGRGGRVEEGRRQEIIDILPSLLHDSFHFHSDFNSRFPRHGAQE
jgi:hypothetical protein